MSKALSAVLQRKLESKGFTILKEGTQIVPADETLVVSRSECEIAGAVKYGIPRIVMVQESTGKYDFFHRGVWKERPFNAGNDIFFVFDTIVKLEGVTGNIAFHFSLWRNGCLRLNETAVGMLVFTEQLLSKAQAI